MAGASESLKMEERRNTLAMWGWGWGRGGYGLNEEKGLNFEEEKN